MESTGPALAGVLLVVVAWLVIGAVGMALPRRLNFIAHALFPASALLSVALAVAGVVALPAPPHAAVLLLGLPDLPFHVRLDALSAFFLVVLGAGSAGASLFSAGYFRASERGTSPGLVCLQYHVFLAAMAFVLIADDAYAFMVAWETMALASFFLVTTDHRLPEIRRAGFLYLLIDPRKKKLFEEICAEQDLTPSQVVRRLIREYIFENAGSRKLPGWLVHARSSSDAEDA